MYYLPEHHAHEECVIPVCEQKAQEMEVHCQIQMEDSVNNEYFEYILENEGFVFPGTVAEAVTLYKYIIDLQNE